MPTKKCDKCQKAKPSVSYTETINGKTKHLDLCPKCANTIVAKKEKFLNSFFGLDPFQEVDQMFDSLGFSDQFMPGLFKPLQITKKPATPSKKPQKNPKEETLRELKEKIDTAKQAEGIAVMLQDYLKAAEIKKKREKLQKEAEKIAFDK